MSNKIVEAYIKEDTSVSYQDVETNPKIKNFFDSDSKRVRYFSAFLEEWQDTIEDHYKKDLPSLEVPTIKCSIGKSYIKVHNGNSVMAFVDHFGNIYKPAGWQAPAKGVRYYVDSDNIKFDSYGSFLYGNSNLIPKTKDDWG